jgi:nitrite reductase/ring-hydroxylating ferredoxin subunit
MARELGADNVRINCIAPGLLNNDATSGVPQASAIGTFRIAQFPEKERRKTSSAWFPSSCRMMHPLLQARLSWRMAGWYFERKAHGIRSRTEDGIQNMWYPVCQSAHVQQRPLGLQRLGIDIVLWRDSRGKIHAHDDRCLHRGAKLSVGTVMNDELRCAYHGWCYDTAGHCTTIPTSKTAQTKLAPRLRLREFETQERAGSSVGLLF